MKPKKRKQSIMEGYKYNDTNIIPPILLSSSAISINKNNENEADQSILTERQRRAKMSENFSVLQSMVPTLLKSFKPPKEKIITETTNYIKYLEQEAKRLESLKKCQFKEPKSVLSKCTNHNSSKNVAVSNGATFFAIQLPVRQGLVLEVVKVFEKHRAEVLEARV
ncbi:hypothetical protein BUALT_Bualt14G0076400 [Buddleja alternifolia]|uniref:BHLH domain-containing protein n=1 Tax=Buddleja alternifolia TaxID=168488 RepID=A0AAV6WHQ1_9LAMI|nr:hypothetical protein BUALT_Bualt14G0076400 [Buddleja alternifolia]